MWVDLYFRCNRLGASVRRAMVMALSISVAAGLAAASESAPVQSYDLAGLAYTVSYSADGSQLAIGGWQTLRIVDADTGVYLHTLRVPDAMLLAVDFSPDGSMVMAQHQDWTLPDSRLVFLSTDTGEEAEVLPAEAMPLLAAAWSPDGARIVTGHSDHSARIWDAETGAMLRAFDGHGGAVNDARFSPDGTTILTGSSDASARIWNAATGALVRHYEGHEEDVTAVAFTPDGLHAVSAAADESVQVWEVETGEEVSRFPLGSEVPGTGTASRLTVSPDNRLLAVDRGGWLTSVWELETGEPPFSLSLGSPLLAPIAGAFSPDGAVVLTLSGNGQRLDWWDSVSGDWLGTLGAHPYYFRVETLLYSTSGERLLSAGGIDNSEFEMLPGLGYMDNTVRLWDTATATPTLTLTAHQGPVRDATLSPDGSQLLTGSADGSARVWDLDTGDEVHAFEAVAGAVTAVAYSPGGEQLLLADSNSKLHIIDAATNAPNTVVNSGLIARMAYAPDGSGIATVPWAGQENEHVQVRDPESGEVMREIGEGLPPASALAFTPDGSQLLTAAGATAYLWDWETGEEIRSFPDHAHRVGAVAVSPNGRYAATGTSRVPQDGPRRENRSLRIWDLATGEEMRQYTVFPVTAIAFSPKGERITAALETPWVNEWDIADISPYQVGDLNNDGVTNAVDVQLVINAALGLELPVGVRADRNFSGVVNAVDVQLVINAALGIEE